MTAKGAGPRPRGATRWSAPGWQKRAGGRDHAVAPEDPWLRAGEAAFLLEEGAGLGQALEIAEQFRTVSGGERRQEIGAHEIDRCALHLFTVGPVGVRVAVGSAVTVRVRVVAMAVCVRGSTSCATPPGPGVGWATSVRKYTVWARLQSKGSPPLTPSRQFRT